MPFQFVRIHSEGETVVTYKVGVEHEFHTKPVFGLRILSQEDGCLVIATLEQLKALKLDGNRLNPGKKIELDADQYILST